MSADRWSQCPNCYAKEKRFIESVKQKLKESYGKIPREDYEAHAKNLVEREERLNESNHNNETLRQDWKIHLGNDGNFYFQFSCSCSQCKATWGFKHEELIEMVKPESPYL